MNGTWTLTVERYIAEGRSVSGGKGDQTAKASEEQSLALQKQMADLFTKQYGDQSQITKFLTSKLEPIINNPQGYGGAAEAALRTSAADNVATNYENAQKALQTEQFAKGGRDLPSGVNAQIDAQLAAARAGDAASAQTGITLQNENLKQQNFWDAINGLSGNAQIINPQSYAAGSSSAAGAGAQSGQLYQSSRQSQLLGALGGVAGGAGAALAGYFGGKHP